MGKDSCPFLTERLMTRTLIIILASLMLFPFKLNAQNFKPLNEIIMKENFDDLSVRLNIFLRFNINYK
jgi:hypothetical protein